jgi:hypothetical protein
MENKTSDLLFSDYRYLLYDSLKEYVEDCFTNSPGLRELWSDLINDYRANKGITREDFQIIFNEDIAKKMRQAEWDIDVALFGYYAKKTRTVNYYSGLKEKSKERIKKIIFKQVDELKKNRLENKLLVA